MSATNDTLGTITTAGGLWGGPLLAALQNEPGKLPGTKPADYGLPPGLDLRDAARGTWTILKAAWADFDAQRRRRAEHLDTEWYGTDNFTLSRWLHHLFEQLGYHNVTAVPALTVDGARTDDPADAYPISHLWNDRVPLHLLPAGVPLDKTTPHVPGAARQSPHSTMQDYLNRTDRHMWGIATNGLTLRLLHNNAALTRQAYVEFDLASMFADDNYADFAVLWLALHATRFAGDGPADCIAEQWQQHAAETGVRALDALRGGVEAAIEQIGQGLVEHPDNNALRNRLESGELDGQALYRQLLYVAYRHVFLFAVEDRDLLHPPDADPQHVATYRQHYSTRRLRDQARRHLGGQHPDGWEIHKTITAALANPDGQPLLALPPVLGSLWDTDSTSDLADAVLTNRRYYAALRNLAFVQRDGVTHRVDYRGMGSDELGAVYEALLEVNATASATAWTFELSRTAGNERKTTGSYYTPTSLIARVLNDALDPVVARAIRGKDGTDAADAILQLTVCDPAMGSAHFLTGAAHRLAKHVAANRTGQAEPSPDEYREALRDVVSRCIYGVDVNPMAVQLAKTALWLECHVPGKPLTFLDHHLKCGNALLGVGLDASLIDWTPRSSDGTPESGGVPDAAFTAVTADDRSLVKVLKSANRQRRAGVASLLASGGMHDLATTQLAEQVRHIAWMDDATPEGLAAKQRAWMVYGVTDELHREKLKADAWTACWTILKTREAIDEDDRPFDVYYDAHRNGLPADTRPGVTATRREVERLRFFHWYVEFPEIAEVGGFSCIVGNPPWEQIRLLEREWFSAAGRPDISEASAKSRKNLIERLPESDDPLDISLGQRWVSAVHDTKSMEVFARKGGRFPHGGVGRVNTYALFADHFVHSINTVGQTGFIVPTGLITDYTYRDFFASLVSERRLVAAYDFENRRALFPEVHRSFRFVTLIATGGGWAEEARFAFMLSDPADLDEAERSYTLSAEQIALVNPNTRTAPVFLTARDKDLTCRVYAQEHMSPLITESPASNRWSVHLTSVYLETAHREHLWSRKFEASVPVADAKTFHQFDDRWATYDSGANVRPVSLDEKANPEYSITTRLFAERDELCTRMSKWPNATLPVLAWRDVARATDERTAIAALIPHPAVDSARVAFPSCGLTDALVLLGCWNSYAFDYIARQKLSGTHLAFNPMKQLPVPNPDFVSRPSLWKQSETLRQWISERSAALSATTLTVSLALGYENPVTWCSSQREGWRAELDAAMFHVYGYSRDEVAYVMDTFPITARKDRQAEGLAVDDPGWRTKRSILTMYDSLAEHAAAGTTYVSPHPPPSLPSKLRLP